MAVSHYVYLNKIFLALGSNVGNWKVNFNNCLSELQNIGKLISIGNIYISKPYGYKEQNDFYNTAVKFQTTYSPIKLMQKLQLIEKNLQKKKLIENGPRRIDIDIIFFNSLKINKENLVVPHPKAVNRDFVIFPLCDIDPYYKHPIEKKSLKKLKIEIKIKYIKKKIKQPKDLFVIH
jgi:2-amino-4-hydroxy-6-hydroxymethyldihydropteridine diphosphokinase